MNIPKSAFCVALYLGVTACTVPHMQVPADLRTKGTEYPVQGRQGWQINQKLRIGPYQTGPVKRGWTKGYDYPFIVRFSGAKEKLQFQLYDEAGQTAEVFCLGKLTEKDLLIVHDYFDINLQTKDAFSGTVVLGSGESIDFLVSNLNQDNTFRKISGTIRGENLHAEIRPVTHLDSGQKSLDTRVPGLEFLEDGRVVAAVETLNEGRFWLMNDLSGSSKLVLTSVAAAVLLRSDLADHND